MLYIPQSATQADMMFFLPAVYDDIADVNRKYFHWGECDNTRRECRSWAKQGMCEYAPDKMNLLCPWSCHKCAPEQMGKYHSNLRANNHAYTYRFDRLRTERFKVNN